MAKKLLDAPESENKKELKSESKNIEKSKQDKKKEKKIYCKFLLGIPLIWIHFHPGGAPILLVFYKDY